MKYCYAIVRYGAHQACTNTDINIACGLWLQNRKCMRPMANWAKPRDPDEKERQAPPTHQRKGSSSGTHAASDASQGTAPSSGAASPVSNRGSGGGTRLSSRGPSVPKPASPILGLSRLDGEPLDEASAAAALQKAIQSSPARLIGSQNSPIEVQDLTPKPTRRLLFPSPSGSQASGPLHETDGNIQRAALTTSTKAAEDGITLTEDQDKENQPPRRSSSPTLFKTPFKSPNRPLNANGDILLSAAKANPLSQTTPKRMPSNQQNQVLTEMTPFTAQLNQMLSEANQSSPSQGFDFPTLPSLRNTPGRNNLQFDFSNFDSEDFLSTDLRMASSPPALWGIYEDPADQENWPFPDTPKSKRYSPEKGSSEMRPGLSVDENGRARVDMA